MGGRISEGQWKFVAAVFLLSLLDFTFLGRCTSGSIHESPGFELLHPGAQRKLSLKIDKRQKRDKKKKKTDTAKFSVQRKDAAT